MKTFSELGIETNRSFEGPKKYAEDILNLKIVVEFFEVRKSKKNDGSDCLYMQILLDGKKYLFLSSSTFLINMLRKVNPDDFPFQATVVKVNRHYEFK